LGYAGVKMGLFKTMQGQGAMTFEQIPQGISTGSINAPSCHNLLSTLGRYQLSAINSRARLSSARQQKYCHSL